LDQTKGVESAYLVGLQDKKKLLQPWLGADFPLEFIVMPALIEIKETEDGIDYDGLRLRLSAELPSAILDNHMQWRRPIEVFAVLVSQLGMLTVVLVLLASLAMVSMAANAALSANIKVLRVLRLVGTFDAFIVTAFVRKFTRRVFLGSFLGTTFASLVLIMMPDLGENLGILNELSLDLIDKIWIASVPLLFVLISIFVTRHAVKTSLKRLL